MALLEGEWKITKKCTAQGCTGVNEFTTTDIHRTPQGEYYGICGACQSGISIPSGQIPPGVQTIVAARIVPDTEKRIKLLSGQEQIRKTWGLIYYQLTEGNISGQQREQVKARWKRLMERCQHPNASRTSGSHYTEGVQCDDCGYNSNGYANMPEVW